MGRDIVPKSGYPVGEADKDVVGTFLALVVDFNLCWDKIDAEMMRRFPEEGWKLGRAQEAYKKYPALREDVAATRALAIREAGLDKVESMKVIKEQESATTESGHPDGRLRLMAAKESLALMGEKSTGSPTVVINQDQRSIVYEDRDREAREFREKLRAQRENGKTV